MAALRPAFPARRVLPGCEGRRLPPVQLRCRLPGKPPGSVFPRRGSSANDAGGGAQAGRGCGQLCEGLGFSPGADYKKASRVFGGITTADCDEEFVFGKDGKPFYIQGPWESPARAERILRALEARCGEDGYHYIVAADDFELLDGADDIGGSAVTGFVSRAGLEAMAAGLQASEPGIEVRINPPGRRKVSDMISLVADPLLESALDYESKKMIINLAALAWNFTLLDPTAQQEMLAEMAALFQCPEGMEMFLYLADRAARLFPEEDRVICKVETEPALYGDVAVRVASAM